MWQGALTWTADHDRRVLAFKFSPAFSAYAAGSHTVTYPSWVEEMKPEQRAVLFAPVRTRATRLVLSGCFCSGC